MGKIDALAESLVNTRVKLRIMATTDLHMQVLPFDYQTGKAADRLGIARTAALIKQARLEAQNCLLLDNGDFLCGSDAGIVAGLSMKTSHPMVSIMNYLGYDAGTLGNHDFDYGLPYLTKTTAQARFPYVSANALTERGDQAGKDTPLFPPFTILKRDFLDVLGQKQRIRIGITGFLPPQSISQFETNTQRVHTRDIVEAARHVVPRMKAAGADIIIALAHTGFGSTAHVTNMENAILPLAQINGIDAIISGHGHQVFPGSSWPHNPAIDARRGLVHGIPVVAPGFWGSHLGLIDLDLQRRDQTWQVKNQFCEARPIFCVAKDGATSACVETDRAVSAIIKPLHRRALKEINEPVGKTTQPLNSFFAIAAPTRAVQEIQRAQIWCAQEHFKGYYDPDLPLLSSACSFKTGGYGGAGNFTNISPGIVSMRSIVDLYPFPNQVGLLQINGKNLREWLERAASVFNQAHADTIRRSLKPAELPGYLFESVLGVDYAIDLSQPARYTQTGQITAPDAFRIRDLTYAGQAIASDQRFTMVTNTFRLSGGGFYPPDCLAGQLDVPTIELQRLLPTYFKDKPNLAPKLDHHWRFSPVPGARMQFRTSPLAVTHLDEMSGYGFTPIATDNDGFELFELAL